MLLAALLNGQPIDSDQPAIHLNDRGWQYGDGLFETLSLQRGRVCFANDHWQRLQNGCERLGIDMPDRALLDNELEQLIGPHAFGIVKLMVTRGRSGRGYRPDAASIPTRLWQLFEPVGTHGAGIAVTWCNTRLARNAQLAGIKHLNRLEQVLAQAEWNDPHIAEGLLLDTEGELISGTMTNIFLVLDGSLITPDLRYSGIRGVMREQVLRAAQRLNIAADIRPVWPVEVNAAHEVFVTNVVRGIQPVIAVTSHAEPAQWSLGPVTRKLMQALQSTIG